MACQPVATVPKPARGGTAVEALVGQAGVLNPLFEADDSARDVDSVIYQGLTTVNAGQNVVGQLASDWTISNDHLTYTFNIRTGVRWADGQPFSADDVLFSYHVLQDLEYQQPGAVDWRQVGIAAGGPNQVVFTLKSPSAAFPLALRIGIIAKHLFDGMAPAQIVASPYSGIRAIGTGPFKVAGINSLAITLDRNPYADPQPYLDHLILRTYPVSDPQMAIRAVLSGAADLVGGLEAASGDGSARWAGRRGPKPDPVRRLGLLAVGRDHASIRPNCSGQGAGRRGLGVGSRHQGARQRRAVLQVRAGGRQPVPEQGGRRRGGAAASRDRHRG